MVLFMRRKSPVPSIRNITRDTRGREMTAMIAPVQFMMLSGTARGN